MRPVWDVQVVNNYTVPSCLPMECFDLFFTIPSSYFLSLASKKNNNVDYISHEMNLLRIFQSPPIMLAFAVTSE